MTSIPPVKVTMNAPKIRELSDTMCNALAIAHAGGHDRLFRWPGGYWMPKEQDRKNEQAAFGEYAGTTTIRALIAKGYIMPAPNAARTSWGEPRIVQLTGKALVLIDPSNL